MSCRTNRRANRLSDSDNECFPRHQYNTRSSAHNIRDSFPSRTHRFRQNRDDSPSMDYCFDSCRPAETCVPPKSTSWLSRFGYLIYCLSLGAIAYLAYTQFLVNQELKDLKEDFRKIRGVKKEYTSPAKALDKKCSEALKLFLKDPVSRPDFALESSGGRVVYVDAARFSDPVTLLGVVLCEGRHNPSLMIQATTSPGECWAFKGHAAKAIIELIEEIDVDAVTLEHIPQAISPSGKIDTAPKDFKIWGLELYGSNKALLGQFRYENDSTSVQTFNINHEGSYFKFVEFEVLSNHGNEEFTCVYRLRVHGSPRQSLYK